MTEPAPKLTPLAPLIDKHLKSDIFKPETLEELQALPPAEVTAILIDQLRVAFVTLHSIAKRVDLLVRRVEL